MANLYLGRTTFGNETNQGNVLSEQEVDQLLNDWIKNEKLRLHVEQVGGLMYQWAKEKEGLDDAGAWRWKMAGLLHDADWDQWPDEHCRRIIEELESRNTDPEIIHAIASHGPAYFGVTPVSRMDKMLYAFDELSGLIHAYSLMRPEGYRGMELKGVQKRLKEKSFAANVSRDDIREAAALADISLDDLIRFIIVNQSA